MTRSFGICVNLKCQCDDDDDDDDDDSGTVSR